MERFSIVVRRALWAPVDVLLGALLFWIPDIIGHVIAPRYALLVGLVLFTWFLPLTTVVGLELVCHHKRERKDRALIALAMIFGIWLFGPLCTAVNLNLSGGTFDVKTVAELTAIAPLSMIDLATYDGTLFALPLATLILLLSAGIEWRLLKWFPITER